VGGCQLMPLQEGSRPGTDGGGGRPITPGRAALVKHDILCSPSAVTMFISTTSTSQVSTNINKSSNGCKRILILFMEKGNSLAC
jgi:hypothetical protein